VSFYLVDQWDAKLSQRADIRVRMLMVVVKTWWQLGNVQSITRTVY
jgi:hypothetical protein